MKKKSRVWEVRVLITDTPPGGKLALDSNFLPIKQIREITKRFQKQTGYAVASVRVEVADIRMAKGETA